MNKNSQSPSHKKKRNAFISVVLICALLITGIFAFLTATDSKTNRFTVGKIDIVLHEDNWDEWYENHPDADPDVDVPDFAENLTPGQVIEKAPYVENTGNNEAWTYITVSVPTASKHDMYADRDGNFAMAGANEQIDVKTYAIQTGYITDGTENADTVWTKYINNNNGMTGMFGEERTEDEVELFELLINTADEDEDPVYTIGVNDDVWTQIGDVYKAEGKNVYVYKLAAPLPVDDATTEDEQENFTETIFDAVRLNANIGETLVSLSINLVMTNENREEFNIALDNIAKFVPGQTLNVYDDILSLLYSDEELQNTLREYCVKNYTSIDFYSPDGLDTITIGKNDITFNVNAWEYEMSIPS